MPVLPLVASSRPLPSPSSPRARASATIADAARSFTDPPGFAHSALPRIWTPSRPAPSPSSRSSGVWPTRSRIVVPSPTDLVSKLIEIFAFSPLLPQSSRSVDRSVGRLPSNAGVKGTPYLVLFVASSCRTQLPSFESQLGYVRQLSSLILLKLMAKKPQQSFNDVLTLLGSQRFDVAPAPEGSP